MNEKTRHYPQQEYILGIDEVGRGPLAGPLVVGGALLSAAKNKEFSGIRDSKKLSGRQRNILLDKFKADPEIIMITIGISPKLIDKINIARAANLGAHKVFEKIMSKNKNINLDNVKIMLDGSLYLPKNIKHETIIKGDEKIPAIAVASIVAKETRDKIMMDLHKEYPDYAFDKHKGYGTKLHLQKIEELGLSPIHRKSFRTKLP